MVHCKLSTREANIGRDERRIFVSTTRIVNPGTTRRLDTLDSRAACRRREGRDREICDVASRLCRYRRRACDRVRQDRRTRRHQSNHVLSVPSRHRYRPHRHRSPHSFPSSHRRRCPSCHHPPTACRFSSSPRPPSPVYPPLSTSRPYQPAHPQRATRLYPL